MSEPSCYESPNAIHIDLPELFTIQMMLAKNDGLCMDSEEDRRHLAIEIQRLLNRELAKLVDPLARFILLEVPGYPRATKKYPNGMSAIDSAIEAIKEYQQISHALWGLLDDISTAGDAAKSDDGAFREMAEACVKRRGQCFNSDGYRLFRVVNGREFPDPEPDRREEDSEPLREFVIYDDQDCDYHQGNGEWTRSLRQAMRYWSQEDAERGLDEVDCEKIMRKRLHVYEVNRYTGGFLKRSD